MEERNYEAEATDQGWNPDYDGPNKTDAKTFVEKGEKIAGIANKRVKTLEDKMHHLEDANRKFGEYHKLTLEREQKKGAKQIADLQAELAQAITDGDGQAYTRTQQEIDSIKASQPQAGQFDGMDSWNVKSQQWVTDNQWYNENRRMRMFADGVSDEIRARVNNDDQYFSELSREIRAEFPEEFKNPNKSNANAVEDGGQKGSSNSKAHTYDNLPADAKRACDDFVSQGFMTKEEYVKQYEYED